MAAAAGAFGTGAAYSRAPRATAAGAVGAFDAAAPEPLADLEIVVPVDLDGVAGAGRTMPMILCCDCGVSIPSNPANMCVNCLRAQVRVRLLLAIAPTTRAARWPLTRVAST